MISSMNGCALLHTDMTLRDYTTTNKIYIGAAIMPDYLDETEYAATVAKEFNMIVPENHLKWSFVHPEKNLYDFSGADKIVKFARKKGMKVRGHTLVWHHSIPDWLVSFCDNPEDAKVPFLKNELESILRDHIKTVVKRYKGKIQYWDVVNEVFSENPNSGELRKTFWYNILGKDYIEKAFRWAHEADEKSKLFINDTNIAERNPKSDALYEMIKDLKSKGVPIEGIGFQLHLETDKKPNFDSIEANVTRFIDLGLEVQFTETDVAIVGEVTGENLELQAEIYRDIINLTLKYPEITAFITWGVTDKYSWLSSYAAEVLHSKTPYGSGLLFDEHYERKPAYYAVKKALSG